MDAQEFRRGTSLAIKRSWNGFTLIEMLVVIAVIGILAALILPALAAAKERGKRAQCINNVKQVDITLELYAEANNEKFPQVAAGRWAWDLPVAVAEIMVSNANWHVYYCPSCGLTEEENLYLWNFSVTNSNPKYRYRVIGYAMTFPGTSTVLFTNQNPGLLPQLVTDAATGDSFSILSTSDRVLVADAVISQPHDADENNRQLNTYVHVKGGDSRVVWQRTSHIDNKNFPTGGNLGMLDGHVEWRKFMEMHVRTDPKSEYPVFWW